MPRKKFGKLLPQINPLPESKIDYKPLMKCIDYGDLKKLTEWLNKNNNRPGFNIDQLVNYQGKTFKPLDFFISKYPEYSEKSKDLIFFNRLREVHPRRNYLALASGRNIIPFDGMILLDQFVKTIGDWLPKIEKNTSIFSVRGHQQRSILHILIEQPINLGLAKFIPLLVEKGADVNAKDSKGMTPAILAVKYNHVTALKFLADCLADFTHPLYLANILDLALEAKAIAAYQLIKNILQQKQIQLKLGVTVIFSAAKNDFFGVKFFLEEKGFIDWQEPIVGCTALMEATHNRLHSMVQFLLENKADPNIKDNKGRTVLHRAIEGDNKATLNYLLEKKYLLDIQYQMPDAKCTYLHYAVDQNKIEMARILLNHNVNMNAKDKDERTALELAIYNNNPEMLDCLASHPRAELKENLFNYLFKAVELGHEEVLKKFLSLPNFSAAIFETDQVTILAVTITNNSFNLFKRLVRAGFDINIPDVCGFSALYFLAVLRRKIFLNWAIENYQRKLCIKIVKSCLLFSIINKHDKNIAMILMNHYIDDLDPVFRLEAANYCLENNWIKLAICFKPALKFFLHSPNLRSRGIDKRYFLGIIDFLENKPQDMDSYALTLPAEDQCDFLEITQCLSELTMCLLQYPTHPEKLKIFIFSPPKKLESPMIEYKGNLPPVSPYAFFKSKGLNISDFYEKKPRSFNKNHNTTMPVKKISDPCDWFDGHIISNDKLLLTIEGVSLPNYFLFIPRNLFSETQEQKLRQKSRWHFDENNGLKALTLHFPVKAVVHFENELFTLTTAFSLEITMSGCADRFLCIEVSAQHGRGHLIIPALFLKNGLHHHTLKLPKTVELRGPKKISHGLT